MLGHLAIGAEIVGAAGRLAGAGAPPGAAQLRALPPRARRRARPRAAGAARRRRARLRLARGAGALPPQRARRLGQGRAGARADPPDSCAATPAQDGERDLERPARRRRWRAPRRRAPRAARGRRRSGRRGGGRCRTVLAPGADQAHRDDRQQRGRLGAQLGLVEEDHQRRDEEDPAADPEHAADGAAGEAEDARRARSSISRPGARSRRRQQQREQQRDQRARGPAAGAPVPAITPPTAGTPDERRLEQVDVAVGALDERREQRR